MQTRPQRGLAPGAIVILAIAGAALCAGAVVLTLAEAPAADRAWIAVTRALVIAAPMGVGLATLSRRRDRFAALLVAAGALWSLTVLARVPRRDPVQRRADRRVGRRGHGRLPAALVPVGPVDVVARVAWRSMAAVARRLLYLPTALVVQHYPEPSPWSTCGIDCPPNAFAIGDTTPAFVEDVVRPLREVLSVLVFLGVAVHPGPAHVSGRAAAAPDARPGARHGHLPRLRPRGLRRGSRLGSDVREPSTRSGGSTSSRSGSSRSASPSGCCGEASTPRRRCSG